MLNRHPVAFFNPDEPVPLSRRRLKGNYWICQQI
jgi:hypothetical protein